MRWKFIDRIVETDEIESIRGEVTFPEKDEWHQDHFPGSPTLPGVLQIEVVANLAGKLLLLRSLNETGEWVAPILLKTMDCRFRGMIRPGDLIEAEATIEKYTRKLVYSTGKLTVGGELRATISIASARLPVTEVGDPDVLIPWQKKDILSVYPEPSEKVKALLTN